MQMNLPINKKTEKFVKSFVDQHGGVEEFKKEIQRQAPMAPPPPPRQPNYGDCKLQKVIIIKILIVVYV